jgi:hypothetical protein
MMELRRSAVPSLVSLGLLILVAILLIAGYGVPVGIGFTVGLLLGTLAAGLIWAWIRAGVAGDRSVSFGGWSATSSEPHPYFAVMERQAQAMSRVATVGDGPLRGVRAIGQSVVAGGVTVDLISLEMRDTGGLIQVAVLSRPPNPPAGSQAELTLIDDVGTNYTAACLGGNMASPGSIRLEVRFAPPPPGDARALILHIDEFVEPFVSPGGNSERLVGPWEFRVPLA